MADQAGLDRNSCPKSFESKMTHVRPYAKDSYGMHLTTQDKDKYVLFLKKIVNKSSSSSELMNKELPEMLKK